jgi:hypothetical protein
MYGKAWIFEKLPGSLLVLLSCSAAGDPKRHGSRAGSVPHRKARRPKTAIGQVPLAQQLTNSCNTRVFNLFSNTVFRAMKVGVSVMATAACVSQKALGHPGDSGETAWDSRRPDKNEK